MMRCAGTLSSTLLLAAAALTGCSDSLRRGEDSPTGPSFARKPPGPSFLSNLPDFGTSALAGVYDRGTGLPFPGEPSQNCTAGREVLLVTPAGVPGTLGLPPVCPTGGRSQVHFPGDPLGGDQPKFGDDVPAYTIKGKTWQPSGWMSPTLNYFWDGCSGSLGCNFVWTDGKVEQTQYDGSGKAISSVVTGHCAKLYTAADTLPISPGAGAPTCVSRDKAGNPVPGFPIELNVVVTVQ